MQTVQHLPLPDTATAKPGREEALDALRAIAIISVVAIHSVTRFSDGDGYALVSLFLRPAVPVFVFLLGYLYTGGNSVSYLHRRLWHRLVPPYLVISVVGIVASGLIGEETGIGWAVNLLALVTGNVHGIYYFVFVSAYLYVGLWAAYRFGVLPVHITAALVISAGIALVHAILLDASVIPADWETYLYRSPAVWVVYVTFGVWWHQKDVTARLRRFRHWAWLVWAAFAFLVVAGSVNGYIAHPYASILTLIYGVATIIAIMLWQPRIPFAFTLSRSSYTIYLAHIWVIQVFVLLVPRESPAWILSIACGATALLVSLGLAMGSERVRGGRILGTLRHSPQTVIRNRYSLAVDVPGKSGRARVAPTN